MAVKIPVAPNGWSEEKKNGNDAKERARAARKAAAVEDRDQVLKEEEPEIPLSMYRNASQAKWGKDDSSFVARLAYGSTFESMTMGVIVFNAFWIGIDTEWNHEVLRDPDTGKLPLEPTSVLVENFFCTYFTIELTIRFLAYREKKLCFLDSWFVFDSILVTCMIFETWVMVIIEAIAGGGGGGVGPLSALRLLRLLRLARMGRLMRFLPELAKLVKGMAKAARSVVFIIIFLVLVMYVFSIIFTGTLADREKFPLTPYCSYESRHGGNESDGCLADGAFGDLGRDLFATMGDGFMSLFTRGVLGDNLAETVDAILQEGIMLMWAFFLFFMITFATLLNMLIGVVCEVISDAAAEEEQTENETLLAKTIKEAFAEIDLNADGMVSKVEWAFVKDNEAVRNALIRIGIEEEIMDERLEQMSSMLFLERDVDEDGEQVAFHVDQLTTKVVAMRPEADASALDLSLMQGQVSKDQKVFKQKLRKMQAMLTKHLAEKQSTTKTRK